MVEYRKVHKERLTKQATEYKRNRLKTDLTYKLQCQLVWSTRRVLKGQYSSGDAVRLLGCSGKELKQHLESKFQPGMTWNNYGSDWHIDHIYPLSKARKEGTIEKACHYSNLQPLWAVDNLSKKDKYTVKED